MKKGLPTSVDISPIFKDIGKTMHQQFSQHLAVESLEEMKKIDDITVLFEMVTKYKQATEKIDIATTVVDIHSWFVIVAQTSILDKDLHHLIQNCETKEQFLKALKELSFDSQGTEAASIREKIKGKVNTILTKTLKEDLPHVLIIDPYIISKSTSRKILDHIPSQLTDSVDPQNKLKPNTFTLSDYDSYLTSPESKKIDQFAEKRAQKYIQKAFPKFSEIKEKIQTIKKNSEKIYEGFYPIGAKIHFKYPLPGEKLDLLNQLGFANSSFQLIHADTCLLMPACQSAEELVAMIYKFMEMGVFSESEDPEIQICIQGRLPNELAGILGSATILTSPSCTEYSEESFKTTHDDATGSMMMAYDAGGVDTNFKASPEGKIGRTDIQGRRDINDIKIYQILGNLISQSHYGGAFQELGKEFIQEYKTLLKEYGFQGVLAVKWVFCKEIDGSVSDQQATQHHQAIKKCTDRWLQDFNEKQKTHEEKGLRYDVLKLLTKYAHLLKIKQREIQSSEFTPQHSLLPQ